MKKGYATVIADIDGQIRTEESGLGRLIEMADELTRRLNNLKLGSAGLDPQDVAKAEESLNEQLKVRRGAIEASRKMIEQYKEILRIYTAEQSSGTDDAGVAAAFKDLIRSQNGLYESIYRSQELRLSLDCRPARVTGPPAVPEI